MQPPHSNSAGTLPQGFKHQIQQPAEALNLIKLLLREAMSDHGSIRQINLEMKKVNTTLVSLLDTSTMALHKH